MRRIKVETFLKAIEKNGWPQAYGYLYKTNDVRDEDWNYVTKHREVIASACALGQAALNLHTNPESWDLTVYYDNTAFDLQDAIIELNDQERLSLQQIAAKIREDNPNILNKLVTLR